ncbi:unnamed protein product [Heligmosomoides polygyrus]|uniref:PHD domain-containing protein n=1 Tax=Heligmosomoides polygyrus TaxID=6339 RepID=A0A183G1Z8_HELPZ|nr:unnamed protein product [Heligmosomoides polygyrus]
MKQLVQSLRAQSSKLIGALQMANVQRTVADTCVCASVGRQDADLLVCILCKAKYHGTCCEWDPFFDRLPENTYLCMRCHRGRRPCIEDVQAACNLAPQNSLEVALVRELVSRGRELSTKAMSLLGAVDNHRLSELIVCLFRARSVVEAVLSCEVLDMDIFPKLVPIIEKINCEVPDGQKRAWDEMRNRPTRSSPLPSLYVRSKRGKRNTHGGKHSSKKERKKSRTVYHQDDESCSADMCLKPYGETVGWILCEAGCGLWYHYVCIGMTAESAKSLPAYVCYRCSRAEQQIAQHPVAV